MARVLLKGWPTLRLGILLRWSSSGSAGASGFPRGRPINWRSGEAEFLRTIMDNVCSKPR